MGPGCRTVARWAPLALLALALLLHGPLHFVDLLPSLHRRLLLLLALALLQDLLL